MAHDKDGEDDFLSRLFSGSDEINRRQHQENVWVIFEPRQYCSYIKAGEHLFEVDEFYIENLGLIIAEIELIDEDEVFIKSTGLAKKLP